MLKLDKSYLLPARVILGMSNDSSRNNGGGGGGGWGGGSRFRMSIIRNGNVALSNLRKRHVAMSNLRTWHVPCHYLFTPPPPPYCLSLSPKKDRVAVSILRVHTPTSRRDSCKWLTMTVQQQVIYLLAMHWPAGSRWANNNDIKAIINLALTFLKILQ